MTGSQGGIASRDSLGLRQRRTRSTGTVPNTCALQNCGNGQVEAGEECDDGNEIETDACRNHCASALR